MSWGFLTEFWNSITGLANYPIEFFENIGLAVAGALGNFFEAGVHIILDLAIVGQWLFNILALMIGKLILPIEYVFTFLKTFSTEAFKPVIPTELWQVPANIKSIFETLPYWDNLTVALGVAILLMIGVATIRKLTRI